MLGPRIAALRRHAKLSQAEVAAQLQISPSAMGMYEQGRREPSADMLVDIARTFGVSLDYLLTGSARESEAEAMEKMMLERIAAADQQLEKRKQRPFSREELVVLFAAMLMEGESIEN